MVFLVILPLPHGRGFENKSIGVVSSCHRVGYMVIYCERRVARKLPTNREDDKKHDGQKQVKN